MKVGRRPRLKSSKKYKTSTKLRSRLKITIDVVVVEATETETTETTVGTTIEITRETTTTTTKTETTDKVETGKEDPSSTSRKKLVANKNTRRNLIMRDLEACKRIAAPMKAPEVETEEKEAEVARETMTAETSKKSRKKK